MLQVIHSVNYNKTNLKFLKVNKTFILFNVFNILKNENFYIKNKNTTLYKQKKIILLSPFHYKTSKRGIISIKNILHIYTKRRVVKSDGIINYLFGDKKDMLALGYISMFNLICIKYKLYNV